MNKVMVWLAAMAFVAGCEKNNNIVVANGPDAGGGGAGGTTAPTGNGAPGATGGAAPGSTGGVSAGGAQQLTPCAEEAAPTGNLGRPMVRAQRGDGACFWIDEREVSWDDYEQFLGTGAGEPPAAECAGHGVTAPQAACVDAVGTKAERAKLPVSCVAWCDALAYCRWDGKSLCAGDRYTTSAADASASSWFAACTERDGRTYPYGPSYDGTLCNGKELGRKKPVDAGSSTACATPEGVLDMSGNVAEWTFECNGQPGDEGLCLTRGGSYDDNAAALGCDATRPMKRSTVLPTVGFRCCAE